MEHRLQEHVRRGRLGSCRAAWKLRPSAGQLRTPPSPPIPLRLSHRGRCCITGFLFLLTGPLKKRRSFQHNNPSALCCRSLDPRSSASGAPRCRTSRNVSQRSRIVATERQHNGVTAAESLGCKVLGAASKFKDKGSAWKY